MSKIAEFSAIWQQCGGGYHAYLDPDGWMGEHARRLKVHAAQLHRIRGHDNAGVLQLKARHQRGHQLAAVHRLLDRAETFATEDDENNDDNGEADAGDNGDDDPEEVGLGGAGVEHVTVDVVVRTVFALLDGRPGGRRDVGLCKYTLNMGIFVPI